MIKLAAVALVSLALVLSASALAMPFDAAPSQAVEVITTTTITPVPVDVIEDPAGAANQAREAFRDGRYALLVFLVLLGIGRGLAWAVARWPAKLVMLGSKTARAMLVGAIGVTLAVATSLMAVDAVDLMAVIGAAAMAVAVYLTPEPAKARTVAATAPPPELPA